VLPFSYALRNLSRRAVRTVLTLLGVGLVAFLVILMTGFATGLDASVSRSARADVAYVLGSTGETDLVRSFVSMGGAQEAAQSAPGVLEVDGRRAASVELHSESRVGNEIVLVRGVTDAAWLVHPEVTLVEGVEPRGAFELMVGRLAAARMGVPDATLAVGRTVKLENRDWKIVGRFAAPGTVLEAETWARLDDLMAATRRVDVSCTVLRLTSPDRLSDVQLWAARNVRLEVTATTATKLYGALRSALAPVASLAWIMAALVLVGGLFACANTMFAAVLVRTREMGTLRAVGYGPAAIGVSLLQESLLLGVAGGLLGFLAASAAGEVALRFPSGAFVLDLGSGVRLFGLGAAAAAGLLGGLVPAIRAVRIPLSQALGGRP
jgi:putative ABC transport system permease protein